MNVIAQSQASEHTLVRSTESCSVAILSGESLSFDHDKYRVVAVRNDKNNLAEVIRYYRDAGFNNIKLIIDSKKLPAQAVDFMMINYRDARCDLYDLASKRLYSLKDYNDTIQYLSLCYQLTNCGMRGDEIIDWLAKKLVRTIPLICSDAKSCLRTYRFYLHKDNNFLSKVLDCLELQLHHYHSSVQDFMKLRTPTKTIRTSTLDCPEVCEALANERTLAIKSATGTGKTKHVFGPITQLAEQNNKSVVYLSHLMALVEQYCIQNHAVSYTTQNLTQLEQSKAMGLVVNSVWKAHIQAYCHNADTLIIDEFEKVISTVVCSEHSLQMPKQRVFHCLSEIIRSIPQVIVGDADLSDISLGFLKDLRGDVTLIQCDKNPYLGIEAVITDKNQYLYSQDDLKSKLLEDKVFLFDSLVTLRGVVKQLGYEDKQGLDSETAALNDGVLVIHGENKGMDAQRAFLANPNEEISKYKAIIASPCLGSGFSIVKNFANRVVVFCDKTLNPFELVNFARRFRKAKEICFTVDAHQDFFCRPTRARVYNANIHSAPTDHLEIAFGNVKSQFTAPLGLHLWLTLKELGFHVDPLPSSVYSQSCGSKTNKQYLKAYREALVNAIMQSVDLTQHDVKRLMMADKRTASDNAAISKHTIKSYYHLTEVTKEDVEFHFLFSKNRKLFDKLFSVPAPNEDNSKYSTYRRLANLINEGLFNGHQLNSQSPSIMIHREQVLGFINLIIENRDLVNWTLHKDTHIPLSLNENSTTNKKMLYFGQLMKSLGFEIGRFSGTTNKAKISLTQRARSYTRLSTESLDIVA